MKLSVDTSAYVAFCKNNGMAVDAIQRADQIILPLMVIMSYAVPRGVS